MSFPRSLAYSKCPVPASRHLLGLNQGRSHGTDWQLRQIKQSWLIVCAVYRRENCKARFLVIVGLKCELPATCEDDCRHLNIDESRVKLKSESESLWLVRTPTFVILCVKNSYYSEVQNLVSCEKWS